MPFEIVRNDITNMQVDAIVNAANPEPVVGSGVDSGIHQKAGNALLQARQEIGAMPYGDAAITPAFGLDAKYVIHAVSPVWYDGASNETDLLEQCYSKALALALEHGCESIAFPLLSSGNQKFPKDVALQIAINAFSKFLMQYDMQIYLVVFDHTSVVLSEKLFDSITQYVDETYVAEKTREEYDSVGTTTRRRHHAVRKNSPVLESSLDAMIEPEYLSCKAISEDTEELCESPKLLSCESPVSYPQAPRNLEDLVHELDETFSEHLIRLIDQKGLDDPYVYKKANVDRKLFSKIKNNIDYKPKKSTALSFAIALELSLDETLDLIGRAGFTLSHSSKFDVIIEFFLQEGIYDMFTINNALFAFGEPTLTD